MACSLEVRSPFLDHHVVELAMKIPPEYKLNRGQHKIVLKQAFQDLLPAAIANRRKQGFEVPFARWFQEREWRSLLIDTISETGLRRHGIFESQKVIALRDRFLDDVECRKDPLSAYQLRHRIWAILIFQLWYERFIRN
jgi:asparagine synthase (glutamine-hydrolysing)